MSKDYPAEPNQLFTPSTSLLDANGVPITDERRRLVLPEGTLHAGGLTLQNSIETRVEDPPPVDAARRIIGIFDKLPDDSNGDSDSRSIEPEYLWRNIPSCFNRILVASGEFPTITAVFKDFLRFEEAEAVLDVLKKPMPEDYTQLLSREFSQFIQQVVNKAPDSTFTRPPFWQLMGLIADTISINQDGKDIPLDDYSLELMLLGIDKMSESSIDMLNFISDFEINRDTASALLDKIGYMPDHPLYWILADRLPNHPEVIRQRKFIETHKNGEPISSLDDIDTTRRLMPIGALTNIDFPNSGLELETTVFAGPSRVPSGTKMGTDAAEGNTPILELRLDYSDNPKVLIYDAGWRERYFKIWRWARVSRAVNTSIHLHSEGQEKAIKAFSLFGLERNDCCINDLGTIEVRTALEGYKHGVGYKGLPNLAMLELLHLCESMPHLAKVSEFRLNFTEFASRVNKDGTAKMISIAIDTRDTEAIWELCGNIAGLERDQQDRLISTAIDTRNTGAIWSLYGNITGLERDQQDRLISTAIDTRNTEAIRELYRNIAGLERDQQDRLISTAIDTRNTGAIRDLCGNIAGLERDQQDRLISTAIDTRNIEAIRSLYGNITGLERYQQDRLISTATSDVEIMQIYNTNKLDLEFNVPRSVFLRLSN